MIIGLRNKINKTAGDRKLQKIIETGKVLYIKYLLLKEDEIRISNFIGLCISKKNKSNTVIIKNSVKKEDIKLIFYLHSPLLIEIVPLKKYRKKYRLGKLYYK